MRKALLSTADIAALFSVTETTVKRWTDEGRLRCQKTPGGHRKFDTGAVMEFSNAYGMSPNGTITLSDYGDLDPQMEVAVLSRDFGRIASLFSRKALSDTQGALAPFFSYLYHHQLQLWEIFDLVIRPGMKEIGDLWKSGTVSVGDEHRSTARTTEAMLQLKTQVHMKPRNGLSTICACPEGTTHELGLRCAALALEAEGWTVHYLGASVPLDSVGEVLMRLNPSLVCLSVSSVSFDPSLSVGLRKLYREARKRNTGVVIGGSAAAADLFRSGECDAVLGSTRELLDFAHRLTGGPAATKKDGQ